MRETQKESEAEGVPARSPAASVGAAGWSWLGRGARILLYIVGLGRYAGLVFALVVVAGVMPCLSFLSELSSSSGRTASTPLAGFPWRKVVVGGRSGDSSSNKLVGRLDLARLEVIAPSVLGRRGGGREQQSKVASVPASSGQSMRRRRVSGVGFGAPAAAPSCAYSQRRPAAASAAPPLTVLAEGRLFSSRP